MHQDRLLQRLLSLQPQLQALAEHLLGDANEAEDKVQDVMVDLWGRRNKLEDIDNLEGYAMNALRNRCISHLRHKRRTIDINTLNNYSDDDARNEATLTEERASMLDSMLKQLPEVQRQAVEMRYIEGVSHEEMQRRLGMSSANVYTTLSRAVSTLKTMSHGR